jgi:two-component system LytT family sensor kinase
VEVPLKKLNEKIVFRTYNTKEVSRKGKDLDPGGIGITNVSRRLELLYPGRHELKIKNEFDWYEVILNLQLQ